MPYVRTIRKAKWYKNANVPWLQLGELQADALGDLATEDNCLSVWHVEDNGSNLERIVVALAAGRELVSNVDYVLVAEKDLAPLGISAINSPGGTADDVANQWHFDFTELTAQKIIELARVAQTQGAVTRISEPKVRRLLASALKEQHLDRTRVRLLSDQLAKVDSEMARLPDSTK